MSDDEGDAPGSRAGEDEEFADVPAELSPLASPLAGDKLSRRLFKCVGKAAKSKKLHRGLREIKAILRKNTKRGLVVLAGDVFPVDVFAHVPVLCEDNNVAYVYVSSKRALGQAANGKRSTCGVFIECADEGDASLNKIYTKCASEIAKLKIPFA